MSVWGWYCRRALWLRILLGTFAGILLTLGIYTAVRAAQYARCGSFDVRKYVPSSAHVAVTLHRVADNWHRLVASPMAADIRRALKEDRDFREFVSSTFASMGLPTIDQLEDERYVRKNLEYLTEAYVFRLFGDGAAAALRVEEEGAPPRFVVAGKLGFGDFWLAPLAELVAPIVLETSSGGCLVIRTPKTTIYARRSDGIVVVGDNEAMVLDALRGTGGVPREAESVVHARVDFQGAPSIKAKTLTFLRDSSLETALYMLNLEDCASVDARISFDERMVTVAADAVPVRRRGERHDDHELHRLIPEGASIVHYFSGGIWELWGKAKESAYGAKPTSLFGEMLAEFVAQLSKKQIETVLFRHLGEDCALVVGSFPANGGEVYPAAALLFGSANPDEALKAMDDLAEGMVAELSKSLGTPVRLTREEYGPCAIRSIDRSGPFPLREVRDICYTSLSGHLAIATSRHFLRTMINRLETAPEHRCPEGGPSDYRLDARALAASLNDLVPRVADFKTDNDATRKAIRERARTTLLKRKLRETDRDFEAKLREIFDDEMRRERQKVADEERRYLRLLGNFGLHELSFHSAENDAVRVVWRIEGICRKESSTK